MEEHLTDSTHTQEAKVETGEPSRFRFSLALVLALLILAMIGASGWLAYPYWQRLQADLLDIRTNLDNALNEQNKLAAQLQQAIKLTAAHDAALAKQGELARQQIDFIARQEQSLSRQEQSIADARSSMARREAALNASIDEVRRLAGQPDNRWLAAEAEYLLEIANARLTLAHDPQTAIAALEQASRKLEATGDMRWQSVREQIGRDLAQLKSVDIPLLGPILAQLDQLKMQAENLPLPLRPATTSAAPADQPASSGSSLSDLGHSIWAGLGNAIQVRRNDQRIPALLSPQQAELVRQNLDLMLEGARLALLQRNTLLFRDALMRASDWINGQFDTSQAGMQDLLDEIGRLAQTQLLPEIPSLAPTLDMLRQEKTLP